MIYKAFLNQSSGMYEEKKRSDIVLYLSGPSMSSKKIVKKIICFYNILIDILQNVIIQTPLINKYNLHLIKSYLLT